MDNFCKKLIISAEDKEYLDSTLELQDEFMTYCNEERIDSVYVVKTVADKDRDGAYIHQRDRFGTETRYCNVENKQTAGADSVGWFAEKIKDITTSLIIVTSSATGNLQGCQYLTISSLVEGMAGRGIITEKRAEEIRRKLCSPI